MKFRRDKVQRRGVTIMEAIVACAMIAVIGSITAQMLSATRAARRELDRRAFAMHTADNLMEEFAAAGWEGVTVESATEIDLPEPAGRYLPHAQVSASVEQLDDPLPAKRITIEVQWRTSQSGEPKSIRIVKWLYAKGAV